MNVFKRGARDKCLEKRVRIELRGDRLCPDPVSK